MIYAIEAIGSRLGVSIAHAREIKRKSRGRFAPAVARARLESALQSGPIAAAHQIPDSPMESVGGFPLQFRNT